MWLKQQLAFFFIIHIFLTQVIHHLVIIMERAAHECQSCLKKTIEDCTEADLLVGMVFTGSECNLRPGLGHNWKEKVIETLRFKLFHCMSHFITPSR